MHINESQIIETWGPIIESKTGIKEVGKLTWLSKYCHYHSLNESFNGSYSQIGVPPAGNLGGLMGQISTPGSTLGVYGDQGSGDKFPSLLPLAIQVAARTIGFDIVNVIPMSGPTGVLTYLDYIYAGGGLGTNTKPTLIKISTAVAITSNLAAGADWTLGSSGTSFAMKFV